MSDPVGKRGEPWSWCLVNVPPLTQQGYRPKRILRSYVETADNRSPDVARLEILYVSAPKLPAFLEG